MKTVVRILGGTALCLAGVVMWSFTGKAGSPGAQAALFGGAVACLVAALWPRWGVALMLAGIMALALDRSRLDLPNVWNVSFVVLFATGAFYTLRRWTLLAWMGASFPCWAMGHALPFLTFVGMGLCIGGFALARVRPLLSRPLASGVTPLPHLSNGPLIEVPVRAFQFTAGRGVLSVLVLLCALALVAGGILQLTGKREAGLMLAIPSAILAGTFAFSLWFSGRMRFRTDATGLHSRVLFGETSIPWKDVGDLGLRTISYRSYAVRYVYYWIASPHAEITWPDAMAGARELREIVEKATGLKWPPVA